CVNPDEVNALNNLSTMNKILEYMALGKPIVQFEQKEGRYSAGEASRYAAANDAIDFAEKIIELLDSPGQRATMGAIGRQRIESAFAWKHQTRSLLACYQRVLGDKGAPFEAAAAGANRGSTCAPAVVRDP